MSRSAECRPSDIIRARAGEAPVALGLVLGSGLGHLADAVDGVASTTPTCRAFRMPASRATSRSSWSATSKACASPCWAGGRTTTRTATRRRCAAPLETLRALGAGTLILTNAAGSFRADMPPGELMLLTDHINFSGRNPLIGEPTDARFVNMTDAYDPGAARRAPRRGRGRGRARCTKASMLGIPARASRRRRRSGRCGSSAPTPSACRRCPR